MVADHGGRLRYLHRAVAAEERSPEEESPTAVSLRMQLASTVGDPYNPNRDVNEEEKQLRFILRAAPGYHEARLQMGLNLMDRGRADDAFAELMMALQLPDEGNRRDPSVLEYVRSMACEKLAQILASRAARRASVEDHAGAITDLQQLLRLDPTRLPSEEAARCELNLALSFSASGRSDDAAAAIQRAVAYAPEKKQLRAMLQRVAALQHEYAADELIGRQDNGSKPAAAIALYEQAKEGYRAANAICDEPPAREAFLRVQVKMSPKTTINADGSVFVTTDGSTAALSLEQLPEGPPSDIEGWGHQPHYPPGSTLPS